MSQPFVGEIRMFGGNFAPAGWMFCEGQLLPISENEVLFQLLGTTYGGDGQSTFALPDLRGRVPIHRGQNPGTGSVFTQGETGGVEAVTLNVSQIPAHSHPMLATNDAATTTSPGNNVLAAGTVATTAGYGTDAPFTTLAAGAVSPVGGSQPHENFQPYLCVSFIISLFGIFPTQ